MNARNIESQNEILSSFLSKAVEESFYQLFEEIPRISSYTVFKNHLEIKGSFIGTIQLNEQDRDSGFFSLIFDEATVLNFLKPIYGDKLDKVNNKEKYLQDSVGELTNIIFGLLKQSSNKRLQTQWIMSIPQIERGESKIINQGKDFLVMSFKTSFGSFSAILSA